MGRKNFRKYFRRPTIVQLNGLNGEALIFIERTEKENGQTEKL
ncbi:MAG: hypothetical protein OP8BY_1860 [Candidatus Saccharicenans subterraneus]|uniref:Uncharacterized protein n=1 Tax=Candidatus Saccharicenans subterraneus TaxID=2508984 RepID=A0A3E2BNP8_9BACT|nr:MAG: hypothetical protein OP8BY_1860 [Candidatus Saccharicenans subterraneum]